MITVTTEDHYVRVEVTPDSAEPPEDWLQPLHLNPAEARKVAYQLLLCAEEAEQQRLTDLINKRRRMTS